MHGWLGDPAQVAQGLAHLALFQECLLLVRHLLEPAAPAALHVHAACGNTGCGWVLHRHQPCVGEAAVRFGHARLHAVAGQPPVHEHDLPVHAGQGLAAQRHILDVEG
jgi:hypothetical protein